MVESISEALTKALHDAGFLLEDLRACIREMNGADAEEMLDLSIEVALLKRRIAVIAGKKGVTL